MNQNTENSPRKEAAQSELPGSTADSELRITTDRLRTVQRVAQLGFWDWNIETGDLYWSEEIYPIFGLDPDEFPATYEAFLQAVHPDDRDLVQKAVDAAVNDDVQYNIEHRVVQPDGTILHVNEQGEVTRNEAGEPVRMLGTVINITDRKIAEEAVSQREAELRGLWEAAYDGMITVNAEGLITLVNAATEKMFGYARHEIIGQPIEILIPKHLREVHVTYRKEYQGYPYPRAMGEGLELEGLMKDGSRFPLEISLTPIVIQGEQEILAEIQNVTKRKTLEDQLRQSNKLEALGLMAGGIAHDLNNILTAMMGFTELSQAALGSEHSTFADLEEVMNAGERAQTMIGQMLAFTRQQVLQPQLLNINDTIRNIEKMLRRLVSEDIELILSLDSALQTVHVDPSQLEQIIVNLVVNASDAMEQGGKLIIATHTIELDEDNLATHTLADAGHYVELSVSDTGTGMTPDVREKIFDPFYTTKALGKGTGLGLSTVYGIVTQSRGTLTVYSELGEGTTFKLYFPVANPRIHAADAPHEDPVTATTTGTILLVEDDDAVRNLAKRMLDSNGYTVLDAESAEEALEIVRSLDSIDLAITDIVLKGMKGPELEKELKTIFPDLTVLFISGFAGRALEFINDMDDTTNFLSKPFTRKALLERVAEMLQ